MGLAVCVVPGVQREFRLGDVVFAAVLAQARKSPLVTSDRDFERVQSANSLSLHAASSQGSATSFQFNLERFSV